MSASFEYKRLTNISNEKLEEILNENGKDRWELVNIGVIEDNNKYTDFYNLTFKRMTQWKLMTHIKKFLK